MIQDNRTGNLRQGFQHGHHLVPALPVLPGISPVSRNFKRNMRTHSAIMEQRRQYAQELDEYKQNVLSLSSVNKDLEKRLENEAVQREKLATSLETIQRELDSALKNLEQETKMKEMLFKQIGCLEKELYRMHQTKHEIMRIARENAQLQRAKTCPTPSGIGNSENTRNINRAASVGTTDTRLLQQHRVSFFSTMSGSQHRCLGKSKQG
mmetsp:Transcript_5460/g.6384  ORF Transcript_5460/g.6384 Transcript_5460/m.6384 type:complete len:209 (-) Transcript_5460:906-1532(-)